MKEIMIERMILHYLHHSRIFAWKAKTVGTFDQRTGKYRKTANYMRGVSDILGLLEPGGRLLAIEVKSAKGRLRPEQKIFLDEVNARGGLGFVARSLEDVELRLKGVA